MNSNEAKQILAVLTVAYPTLADDKATPRVKLWSTMFADEPYNLVLTAVQQYLATDTKGFAPTIGKIKEICNDLVNQSGDWSDGWGQVKRAIAKYGTWDLSGALSSFDDITAEVVKRLGWDDICASENIEATRAQFRQAYELVSLRNKVNNSLPSQIKNQIGGLKMLGGQDESSDH